MEKFKEWTDSAETPEDAVDRDQLLTNVSLYWLTGTPVRPPRIYKEDPRLNRMTGSAGSTPRTHSADVVRTDKQSAVPTGVAVLPKEVALSVRRLAEQTHNITHWSDFDCGGHFPAMEAPDLLVADIREFFRQLP